MLLWFMTFVYVVGTKTECLNWSHSWSPLCQCELELKTHRYVFRSCDSRTTHSMALWWCPSALALPSRCKAERAAELDRPSGVAVTSRCTCSNLKYSTGRVSVCPSAWWVRRELVCVTFFCSTSVCIRPRVNGTLGVLGEMVLSGPVEHVAAVLSEPTYAQVLEPAHVIYGMHQRK